MRRIPCLIALLAVATAPAAQDVWTSVPSGTTLELRAVHFVNADVGFVAGAGGVVLRTTDGGLAWDDVTPEDVVNDLHGVHFFDANTGVVVGDQGAIFRTTNAGADWTAVASGVTVTLQSVSFAGSVGLVGGDAQTILRSTDAGATWSIVQTDFFGGGFPGAFMLDATHGYVAGTNSIFQPLVGASDDAGETFDFTAFYFNTNEGDLRDVHFHDASTGVAVGVTWDGRGATSRTTNGGADWTTTIFEQTLAGVDFATATHGYAVGQAGPALFTTDGGVTWSPAPLITSAELRAVDLPTPTTGFAVGTGGTIMRGTLSTASAPAPAGAALTLGVTPNPAAGAAVVRFTLPAAGHATLRVFDATGREVAVVAAGALSAGAHAVALDAASLRAGVYLATLEAAGARAAARFAVIR